MIRPLFICGLTALVLTLAACGEAAEEEPATISLAETRAQSAAGEGEVEGGGIANEGAASAELAEEGATPMAERVATLGLLNKRNNVTLDLELRPGEVYEEGPVIVRLAACERTAPWELPQETGAFVQLDIQERGASEHTRVFSGWLFKQSPSLNVVEHPIYDVWIKDCAMSFPGEEDAPPSDEPSTAGRVNSE
ncbi:MAG: DUF2155 domain-containing protein [Erythrobacter sp.]|nr:DUF2155 domain-containing protein [Erythrobacter sp.]